MRRTLHADRLREQHQAAADEGQCEQQRGGSQCDEQAKRERAEQAHARAHVVGARVCRFADGGEPGFCTLSTLQPPAVHQDGGGVGRELHGEIGDLECTLTLHPVGLKHEGSRDAGRVVQTLIGLGLQHPLFDRAQHVVVRVLLCGVLPQEPKLAQATHVGQVRGAEPVAQQNRHLFGGQSGTGRFRARVHGDRRGDHHFGCRGGAGIETVGGSKTARLGPRERRYVQNRQAEQRRNRRQGFTCHVAMVSGAPWPVEPAWVP